MDLTWAQRAPDLPQVGPLWGPFGGPRGLPKGSNRAKSGELQPDLAQIGPKLAPAGPKDPSLCPLGAPRGPPRAPKRAPREPPKGLEKQHELKTLSDDDFLLVSNILVNRPHSENQCFLYGFCRFFINQLFRYMTVSGPHLEAIWSPFWGSKRAPNEFGNDCLHHIEVELPTRPLLSPHRALKKQETLNNPFAAARARAPEGGRGEVLSLL